MDSFAADPCYGLRKLAADLIVAADMAENKTPGAFKVGDIVGRLSDLNQKGDPTLHAPIGRIEMVDFTRNAPYKVNLSGGKDEWWSANSLRHVTIAEAKNFAETETEKLQRLVEELRTSKGEIVRIEDPEPPAFAELRKEVAAARDWIEKSIKLTSDDVAALLRRSMALEARVAVLEMRPQVLPAQWVPWTNPPQPMYPTWPAITHGCSNSSDYSKFADRTSSFDRYPGRLHRGSARVHR